MFTQCLGGRANLVTSFFFFLTALRQAHGARQLVAGPWFIAALHARGVRLARTQRGGWKNLISYEMLYHVEHHLFPVVPTPRLPELAARLDRVMPELTQEQVFYTDMVGPRPRTPSVRAFPSTAHPSARRPAARRP